MSERSERTSKDDGQTFCKLVPTFVAVDPLRAIARLALVIHLTEGLEFAALDIMGVYRDFLLPRLCHLAMRNRRLAPYRERIVSAAEGRVLEIGIGSGLNLPLYRPKVRELLGLDPGLQLIEMARRAAQDSKLPVSLIEGSAEAIPLESHTVDTVLTTWTLCTIPHANAALVEMRRVLKPNGRLLFVEHGLAPEQSVRKWQDRLTPIWSRISGGCHINRPIRTLIENAGFRFDRLDTGYMPGPKLMAYMYEGSARPS